ncbi:FapA family protein [bacterium]|nr:FapA family protein [bacterium]
MEIFRLQVDSSKMNANLSISKIAAVNGDIKLSMALDYLKNSGVIFGIDEETIQNMIDQELWDKQTKIASGIAPVKGEDGREVFYFDTVVSLKPKVLEGGRVDFKDVHLAQNVKAGEKLAERIPPTKGIHGINVYGEEVLAEPGIEGNLTAGENTKFTDKEQSILIASVDGNVKLQHRNTVVVNTIFQVDKNVDFSTGNLDVTGDINIRGNILSGFKVKSTGNVTVNGIVEDAIIEAGGDVMVKMGFSGTGKGIIYAHGKVILKYVNNQTVNAEEIRIGEEAFHANLNATNSIIMTRGKGTIIGGSARAGKSIEINTCGCDNEILTELIVAENAEISEELDTISEKIEVNTKKFEEYSQRIVKIMKHSSSSDLSDNQKRFILSLHTQRETMNEKNAKLTERKEKLEKDYHEKTDDAFVKINRKIYPRAKIQIAKYSILNETIRSESVYRLGDSSLIVTKDFN